MPAVKVVWRNLLLPIKAENRKIKRPSKINDIVKVANVAKLTGEERHV